MKSKKTIGLIGGMSWESSIIYYQTINRLIAERMGGLHSGRIILHSLDFSVIVEHMKKDEWDEIAQVITAAAKSLENSGDSHCGSSHQAIEKLSFSQSRTSGHEGHDGRKILRRKTC